MGYFQVRYDSRVVHYDCRGFIRLATDNLFFLLKLLDSSLFDVKAFYQNIVEAKPILMFR